MINKFKKILLYYRALYRGELFKKLDYKIKDLVKYFYFRNRIDMQVKDVRLGDVSLNLDDGLLKQELNINKIKIFNKYYSLEEIKNSLQTDNMFWRNIRLNSYNDVKITWEYNRLQFLLPMVKQYIITKNDKYKKDIISILDDWDKNNSYEYSVNWNSNLEVAIRAINISLVLMSLSDETLNNKYSKLLYFHAKHLYNEIDYSDCCIPNNHVIGEATALLMLSKIIDVKDNKRWYKKSIKILEKYLDVFDEDGLSKENSFTYQWFVTKMYILSLCFIDEDDIFKKINNKVNKSLDILNYTFVDNKLYLNYGDNDDGYLYSFNSVYNYVDDIIQYYDIFTDNKTTDETLIYLEIFNKFSSEKIIKFKGSNDKYFCNKKIFIYKDGKNLLFFNAKNIEGHAHNDSLAISLIINGKDVLLDSGTYSYNLDKNERSYYRGRESHSTIQFDEVNATEISTFRWINKTTSSIDLMEETDEYIKVIGMLNNLCSREITIYKDKNLIKISDYINNGKLKTNWIVPKESKLIKQRFYINNVEFKFNQNINIEEKNVMVSKEYLSKNAAKKYIIDSDNELKITMQW